MADDTNTRLVRLEVNQELLKSDQKELKMNIDFAIKDLKVDFDRSNKDLKNDFDKRFHEQKIDVDKKFDEIKKDMKDNFNDQNIKLDSIIKTLSSVDLKKIDETVQEMEHKRFVFTGGYKMIIFLVTAVGSIAVTLDWVFSHFTK